MIFIRRRNNPSTTIRVSKLKDDIKPMKASAFKNNIIRYNTWIDTTRDKNIKEKNNGCNKYLRSMFRAYLSCGDADFVDTIKGERRK